MLQYFLLSIFQQRCKQQKKSTLSLSFSSQSSFFVYREYISYFHKGRREDDEYHDNDDLVLIIMFTVYSDTDGCMMSKEREEETVVPVMNKLR